jgi:hypothetical protein
MFHVCISWLHKTPFNYIKTVCNCLALICEVRGPQGNEYEEYCVMGCEAVYYQRFGGTYRLHLQDLKISLPWEEVQAEGECDLSPEGTNKSK